MGPGHQSLQLMLILKPQMFARGGSRQPRKLMISTLHFFFLHLNPNCQGFCASTVAALRLASSPSQKIQPTLGISRAIWKGPAVLSRSGCSHFLASEPQGLNGALAAESGEKLSSMSTKVQSSTALLSPEGRYLRVLYSTTFEQRSSKEPT